MKEHKHGTKYKVTILLEPEIFTWLKAKQEKKLAGFDIEKGFQTASLAPFSTVLHEALMIAKAHEDKTLQPTRKELLFKLPDDFKQDFKL